DHSAGGEVPLRGDGLAHRPAAGGGLPVRGRGAAQDGGDRRGAARHLRRGPAAPMTAHRQLQRELQDLLDGATSVARGGAPGQDGPLDGAPGAVALIARRGEVLAQAQSGWAVAFDADGDLLPETEWEPVTGEQLWDVASVTKLLTAVTALVQVDAGVLDLDRPVAEDLPELAAGGDADRRRIVPRQLLTHTAGRATAVAHPGQPRRARPARAVRTVARPTGGAARVLLRGLPRARAAAGAAHRPAAAGAGAGERHRSAPDDRHRLPPAMAAGRGHRVPAGPAARAGPRPGARRDRLDPGRRR